jgi:hypothetical protein
MDIAQSVKLEDFAFTLASVTDGNLKEFAATRRGLILAPVLAALPVSLLADQAHAIDPTQTQVILPDQYQWKPALPTAPPQSVETVPVFGATDKAGPYVVLVKWHPGYMSAPRTYVSLIGYALSSPAPGGSIRVRILSRRRLFRCPPAASCTASHEARRLTVTVYERAVENAIGRGLLARGAIDLLLHHVARRQLLSDGGRILSSLCHVLF